MLKFRCVKKLPLFVKVDQDVLIRILYKLAGIRRFRRHISFSVHKLDKGQVIVSSHLGVILAESRCNMNDTRTVCHGDIVVTGDKVGLFVLLCRPFPRAGKERLILFIFQLLSGIGF